MDNAAPAFLSLFVMLAGGLVSLLALAFWIWMLVECLRRKDLSDGEKIAWTVVMVFVTCLGSIIYFFASKRGQRRFS
jgi:drug/metabolite transporter (DMT)-like permease